MLYFLLLLVLVIMVGFIIWASDLEHKIVVDPFEEEKVRQKKEVGKIFLLGSKSLAKDIEFIEITLKDIFLHRLIAFAILGLIPPAILYFIGASPIIIFSPIALGILAAIFLPQMIVKGQVKTLQNELIQAFPQFLALMSMGLSSLNLATSVAFAANASDHRTFQHFRKLIPPANSEILFGQRLYEFGEEYGIFELSNRGLILRTAEEIGGADIRENIQKQARDSRTAFFAQMEEDATNKAGSGSMTSMTTMVGLMVFIMYPVFANIGGGIDVENIQQQATEESQ